MKLCILCDDTNITEARQRVLLAMPGNPDTKFTKMAKELKEKIGLSTNKPNHLSVPCSPTGKLPATHWFCFVTVNEETQQKMLDNQLYTIIEEGVPSEFLAKYGLQRIKNS